MKEWSILHGPLIRKMLISLAGRQSEVYRICARVARDHPLGNCVVIRQPLAFGVPTGVLGDRFPVIMTVALEGCTREQEHELFQAFRPGPSVRLSVLTD